MRCVRQADTAYESTYSRNVDQRRTANTPRHPGALLLDPFPFPINKPHRCDAQCVVSHAPRILPMPMRLPHPSPLPQLPSSPQAHPPFNFHQQSRSRRTTTPMVVIPGADAACRASAGNVAPYKPVCEPIKPALQPPTPFPLVCVAIEFVLEALLACNID